jgi:hypothetical protein
MENLYGSGVARPRNDARTAHRVLGDGVELLPLIHVLETKRRELELLPAQREMYKHTRLIYNPVPMIVDFYVDNIWRPAQNNDFESLVTPLSPKTDEAIIEAVAQVDQWSNFLADAQKIKRYAAATGNVLSRASTIAIGKRYFIGRFGQGL